MSNIKSSLAEEIETLLCKVPDVKNCSVICDENGSIEEIHVLAAVGRNIKQLVRDIQSAVNARFNISVDYKKISIAQIDEAELREARVKIDSIVVKNVENYIEATVILVYEDKKYQGTSTKVKSKSNRAKAIAEATLGALERYLGIQGVFYLEGLEGCKISGREVFVTIVGFSRDNVEEVLTGSSIVSLDENESAVKAVLAAVNRKMNLLG